MVASDGGSKVIRWRDLVAFAHDIDRDVVHVYRVFKGERVSPPIAEEFERRFGVPIADAQLAGRKPIRRSAA